VRARRAHPIRRRWLPIIAVLGGLWVGSTVTPSLAYESGGAAQGSGRQWSQAVPPTAHIASPAPGETLSEGVVTLSAGVSREVRVTRVEFRFSGGCCTANALAGVAKAGAFGWTLAWDTHAVPDGTYTLVAQAFDAAGNSGSSPAVTVNVRNPRVRVEARDSLTSVRWLVSIGILGAVGLLAVSVVARRNAGTAPS
jgi:hypothetical protein